jgi:hypothetical protein
MSLETFLTDGSDSSDANDSENVTFGPNESTDLYYGLGNVRALVGALAEEKHGDGSLTTDVSDDTPAQVRYWAAVHELKNRMGARQKDENSFSLKDENGRGKTYAAEYGDVLPALNTEPLSSEERSVIVDAGLEPTGFGPNGGEADVLIPVAEDTRLPIAVSDGDDDLMTADEAINLLMELPDEPGTWTGGSTDEDTDGSDDGDDASDGKTCPHCGDTFDPRGYGPHVEACDGDEDDETDEPEADDGENTESDDEQEATEIDEEELAETVAQAVVQALNG